MLLKVREITLPCLTLSPNLYKTVSIKPSPKISIMPVNMHYAYKVTNLFHEYLRSNPVIDCLSLYKIAFGPILIYQIFQQQNFYY